MAAPSPLRLRLLAGLIAGFLVVQVAVPGIALFGPRPARFGWHMYSALPPVPQVWLVHADGTEEEVDLSRLFVVQRAEIDYADAVRSRLCRLAGAAEIRMRRASGDETESIRCT